jgi:hypothetical protein
LRQDLDEFLGGEALFNLRSDFVTAVAKLKFIPVVERDMEAKRKDMKHVLASLTRHSAARVSLAVRGNQLWAALSQPGADAATYVRLLDVARNPRLAAAELGLLGHPMLHQLHADAARRGRLPLQTEWLKALVKIVYRCDLISQHRDLGELASQSQRDHAREKAAAAEAMGAAAAARRRSQPLPINTLLGSCLADHLQQLCKEGMRQVVFSVASSGCGAAMLSIQPLSELLRCPDDSSRLPLPLVAELLEADGDDGQAGSGQDPHVFFTLMFCKSLGRVKTVPVAPRRPTAGERAR